MRLAASCLLVYFYIRTGARRREGRKGKKGVRPGYRRRHFFTPQRPAAREKEGEGGKRKEGGRKRVSITFSNVPPWKRGAVTGEGQGKRGRMTEFVPRSNPLSLLSSKKGEE